MTATAKPNFTTLLNQDLLSLTDIIPFFLAGKNEQHKA